MKYLDENIVLTVNNLPTHTDGLYRYLIYQLEDDEDILLFLGNTYIKASETSKAIDITDIIAGTRWIPKTIQDNSGAVNLIKSYRLGIKLSNTEYTYSDAEYVALIYRYPHYSNKMKCNFFDYDDDTADKILNCLQGNKTGSLLLVPHIPYILSHNYGFGLTIEQSHYNSRTSKDITLELTGAYNKDMIINFAYPTASRYLTLYNIFNGATPLHYIDYTTTLYQFTEFSTGVYVASTATSGLLYVWDEDGHLYIEKEELPNTWQDYSITFTGHAGMANNIYVGDKNNAYITVSSSLTSGEFTLSFQAYVDNNDYIHIKDIKLSSAVDTTATQILLDGNTAAIVDTCPERYYLLWLDRAGGFQSQAFEKNDTYAEDFTQSEVKTYQRKRQLNNIDIQLKWTLNTGYINEELYPFYESIFTSPFLSLYDADEDQQYYVIITDSSYTEKTYQNQQQSLFNILINLSAAITQNILY